MACSTCGSKGGGSSVKNNTTKIVKTYNSSLMPKNVTIKKKS